jgi:hypothetical protein
VTSAGDERLPPSIGGLIDLAFVAYLERAPLYLGLALAVFVLCGIIEVAWPAGAQSSEAKLIVLQYAQMFASAFVVAAIALGIATRVGGEPLVPRRLLAAAVERWLPVLGATIIVAFFVELTVPVSALGPLPDPPAIAFLTAPLTWLLWGALSFAGPLAALSSERPFPAILSGFGRALALSSQPANFGRLCVVASATIVPLLLEEVLFDYLSRHGVAHAAFWAGFPIDALALGPLTALQTIFALDFVRRLSRPR